jgi:large subunit ribosomal protein L35
VRRGFSRGSFLLEELQRRPEPEADAMALDPRTVHTFKQIKQLKKYRRLLPIGSRRRRLAIASTENVPFSQLPYQCFQEARKVLADHRQEILNKIAAQQDRVATQLKREHDTPDKERAMRNRIAAMEAKIKELKIDADIHDPMIKKTFEDGHGKFAPLGPDDR